MEVIAEIFDNIVVEIFIAGIIVGSIIGAICYGVYKRFF